MENMSTGEEHLLVSHSMNTRMTVMGKLCFTLFSWVDLSLGIQTLLSISYLIGEVLFVCLDETPIAPVTVTEVLAGFSYTEGLNPNQVPLAYKIDVATSLPYDPDDVFGNFRPQTAAMEARSTPIFPVTGASNRRWCLYTTISIEEFGGGCGLSVNGDYTFGGDFAGSSAVYEKITPFGEALPNEKVYLYYIKKAHRWVLGTGFLDGSGLIASFRHEGECPYARGEEEMKIEQTGFCSDLEVGERFTARLTGQSYAAKAKEDGFPKDSSGTFIISILNVQNYNSDTPDVSSECKEKGFTFQGLYQLGDTNKVMGGRSVYYKLLLPTNGDEANEEHFLWYSLSHRAWIINSIIGEFKEPLIYVPYNYEGYEIFPIIDKSWFFLCDGVNSLASLSIYTLPDATTGKLFITSSQAGGMTNTRSSTDNTAVVLNVSEESEESALVIDIVTVPNTNEEATAPSINEETTGPNTNKKTDEPNTKIETTATSINDETTATSINDETTATSINEETTAPSINEETTAPNETSIKITGGTIQNISTKKTKDVSTTTESSTVVTTESNFIPPEDTFEPEPFVPLYNRLSASFVFDGEYCRRAAEKKAVKTSFKEWEVFSGTCYQNGDCPSTSLKCIEDKAEKAFVVQITFKQKLDPDTGLTEGLVGLHDLIAALVPGSVVLTIQSPSRKREAIQFSMEETTAEEIAPVCPQGSVENLESNACDWCLNGTFQLGSACIACGVNEYQDKLGQTECMLCETGYSTDGLVAQSVCVKDGVLEELEEAVSGLSTLTLAVIAAVAALLVVVIIVCTVCIVKKKNNKRGKLQNRVSPTPGRDNPGYLNSQTSVRHH